MGRKRLQSASAKASSSVRRTTRSSNITWTRCTGEHTPARPAPISRRASTASRANFEHQLVDVLHYRIPEKAYPLLVEAGAEFARILDLGCGTGLAAPYLSRFGGRLVGVDISPRMLEKARERETYSRLIEDEAVSYLANCGEQFDLIAAFDVVVYFGDLAGLFEAVASRLDGGGIFAFSFETGQDSDYALLASGRFAHDPGYVERTYGKHFTAIASVPTMVRLEANRRVAGQLVLVRRS